MKTLRIVFNCIIFLLIGINGQAKTEVESTSLNNLRDEKNVFEVSFYQLGTEYYPRFSIEGYSVYRSGWGIWGLVERSQPVIYQKWIEKGYNPDKRFGINGKLAMSYDFNSHYFGKVKLFAGASLDLGKSCFGPLFGVYIDKGKWSLKAMGVYSLATAYKSEYSEEFYERHDHDDPVFIRGFDPNSWYKFSFSYSLNKSLKVGMISERFYSSGLFAEYDFKINPRQSLLNFKLRVISGRNFESKQNCFSAGVIMEIMQ